MFENKLLKILIISAILFLSACSNPEKPYITAWQLTEGNGFVLNEKNSDIMTQYKKAGLQVPYKIIFLKNEVYFKKIGNTIVQKCKYDETSDGFVLYTISDNVHTPFTYLKDNKISVEWKNKIYVYKNM